MNTHMWTQQPITKKRSFWLAVLAASLLLVFVIFILADGGWKWFWGYFGIGDDRSGKEAVIATYNPDSETALELIQTFELLDPHDGISYTPFRSIRKLMSENRDAILSWMLANDYLYYSGNSELLAEARKYYPDEQIVILIPAEDLETVVYSYFGGNYPITHKSTGKFIYLKKVDAYTTVAQDAVCSPSIEVLSVTETAGYYRMEIVTRSDIGEQSYLAVYRKRDDGKAYLLKLYKE